MAVRMSAGLQVSAAAVVSLPASRVLPIPCSQQSGKNWCWAACAELVLNYSQGGRQQCDFAEWLLYPRLCCGWNPPTSACDQSCNSLRIVSLYANWGIAATGVAAPVKFIDVQNE